MARATTTKASGRKPRIAAIPETPKRKPGRPVGSTNAKKTAPPAPVRSAKPVARGAAAKSAPAAPKLSKAELEQHVIKLDRTLARLREKNKELKQAATDAKEHADALQEQLSARPAAEETKAPRKTRRSASKAPATDSMDASEDIEAEA